MVVVKQFFSGMLDLVYPSSCYHCEKLLEGKHVICDVCFEKSKRITEGFCDVCGEDFDGEFTENPICPNCHTLKFSFQYAKSALKNTAQNRQLVISYKYGKRHYLSRLLAKFCSEVLRDDPRFAALPEPVLVPVPLHWRRKFSRGFNQAELICKELTKQTGIPTMELLRRKRYTTTQTRLSRGERLKNLNGAFSVCGDLGENKSIIIIDDVFTTGSTSEECAKLLRKEFPKVENIVVVTVLRG
ncbi:MAG: ComF family protein [Akkermansiaceae bacterium]